MDLFNIIEQIGCNATIYNTLASYFLVFMWPTLLGCISFVYSALTLRAFYKRRIQFAQIISNNSTMTTNRYLRLVILASVEMICTIPISIYSIYIANVGIPLQPYISWANVHFDFSYIGQEPAVQWRSSRPLVVSVELTRWLFPICALLFFSLFGLASDARRHYANAFWLTAGRFGVSPPATKTSLPPSSRWQFTPKPNPLASSVGSLPIYISSRLSERKSREPSMLSSSSFDETDACQDVEKSAGLPSPTSDTCPTTPTSAGVTPRQEVYLSSERLVCHQPSASAALPNDELQPVVASYERPFAGPGVVPLTATTPFFPPPRRAPKRKDSGPLRVIVHTTELRQSD
ncbi:hypothetical protein HWV62_6211 [Athelia sp. TMB]|nr:hypothetical protein HWV62_27357 [Athelia sp. TMB]KAF7976554.1 hypothetical protein HWV62_6211 [Athelia sp. TMB]